MNNKEIQCQRVTEVLATRCDRRKEQVLRDWKSMATVKTRLEGRSSVNCLFSVENVYYVSRRIIGESGSQRCVLHTFANKSFKCTMKLTN